MDHRIFHGHSITVRFIVPLTHFFPSFTHQPPFHSRPTLRADRLLCESFSLPLSLCHLPPRPTTLFAVMNRPLDYDDQTIRATPYETLSDYRSTVSFLPCPFHLFELPVQPDSLRCIGLPRMSQHRPRARLLDGTPRSLGYKSLSKAVSQILREPLQACLA